MPRREENIKNFFPCEDCEWRESGESDTLHSFLQRYEIKIPSGCEFMRFRNELITCWINIYPLRITIRIIDYGNNSTQNKKR